MAKTEVELQRFDDWVAAWNEAVVKATATGQRFAIHFDPKPNEKPWTVSLILGED